MNNIIVSPISGQTRWLVLLFTLPSPQRSRRVEVWRRLKRIGALALGTSGYVLPHDPENREHFQWLARLIRDSGGAASVVLAAAFDGLPDDQIVTRFNVERRADYEAWIKLASRRGKKGEQRPVAALRKRLAEIEAVDFFKSPARERAVGLLNRLSGETAMQGTKPRQQTRQYRNRVWLTRPRPKIDRAFSAWLITRFIDPKARFAFADTPETFPSAIPFDMFGEQGFGHRKGDCTFETLAKEFGIRDRRIKVMAEIVHDADLKDGRFGRTEGHALQSVLHGWAESGIADDELLARGMELAEGLHRDL